MSASTLVTSACSPCGQSSRSTIRVSTFRRTSLRSCFPAARRVTSTAGSRILKSARWSTSEKRRSCSTSAGQDADEIIMRTDFNDRTRLRGRVDWSISRVFRVLAPPSRSTPTTNRQTSGTRPRPSTTPSTSISPQPRTSCFGVGLGLLPDRHRDPVPGPPDIWEPVAVDLRRGWRTPDR